MFTFRRSASPRRSRVVLAATSIALAAAVLTACLSTPATEVRPSEAAPGLHMIENGGHKLAFHVTAGTEPAIVFDAGGGADSSYWAKLVPELSRRTGAEIITYDRSGMGKSEYVAGPFSAKAAASDLHAGLTKLGVAEKAVLVSHSEAGEVATYLVNDYPNDIRGAVLVDASLPEFYTASETARIVAANAPAIAALKKQKEQTQITQQLIDLAENYGPDHLAYNRMSWPSSVPATVIASASTPFPTQLDATRWRAAQAEFAKGASNRRLITAKGSSHDVPLDSPTVVIDEVHRMVKTVN